MRCTLGLLLSLLTFGCAAHHAQPAGNIMFGNLTVPANEEARPWMPLLPGDPHAFTPPSFAIDHQTIHVAFDLDQHAVVGSTDIRVRALRGPLDRIELDAMKLAISSVQDASGRERKYDASPTVLVVGLATPLPAGDTTTIRITYSVVRPRAGVYYANHPRVVWTQGRLEDNRFWVPTQLGPSARAKWDVFVTTEADQRAFSNGRLVGSRPVAGGVEWHWAQESAIPLEYLTIAVGPYETVWDSAGSTKLQYWTYLDSVAEAREGFAVTPRLVACMERKLNTPLPARSLAQAVVPNFIFWDWLEPWRPIIVASVQDDRLIFTDSHHFPEESREMGIGRMVAQEWFGKSVSPHDWSELWLSDGLMSFMAQVCSEESNPPEAVATIRQWSNITVTVADRDWRRPLVYDRWKYGPIELLLTDHITGRGTAVLELLRHELGDSVFWRGMHDYLTTYAGQSATTADFRHIMEQASGRDLEIFFRQWVLGAGFPHLHIEYAYDGGAHRVTLTVRQVQPRDSLTGYFDAKVDVVVGTSNGVIEATVPLSGAVTTYSTMITGDLQYILWDPSRWLPSDVKFPKPKSLLLGQLAHAPLAGRLDALEELSEQARGAGSVGFTDTNAPPVADSDAMIAILRVARSDTSPAMRARAIESTMGLFDARARATLRALTRDTSAAIRGMSAMMLTGPFPEDMVRLRELAHDDASVEVREAAAEALSMMNDRVPQQHIADSIARSPTATDDQRASAAAELANNFVAGSWAIGKGYLTSPSSSRAVREAVMRQMSVGAHYQFLKEANGEELVTLLRPFLDSDDPSLRIAAAREIGTSLGSSARATLEARREVEVDARVLRAIDEALGEIDKGPPMPRGFMKRH
jgi:aminopeptidase N